MDKTKTTINNILYTLEHYPQQPDYLEWGTEQVKILLSRIKELERAIKKHKKQNPWKSLPREIDKELYNLIEEKP